MARGGIVRTAASRRAAGLHALEQRSRTQQLDVAKLLAYLVDAFASALGASRRSDLGHKNGLDIGLILR
jgi:hypothetical protein